MFLLRRAKALPPEATSEQVRQLAIQSLPQYAVASELVTMLGGLPLALDQAGAYLEETRCGLPAYLDLFRTRRDALLQRRGERIQDHPASVSTTFMLAITATAQRYPAVWDLLQVCALLQPDAIPEEIFRQGGKHLGPTLEAVCCDPLEWDCVVGVACSYSLLSRQPEEHALSMHRLVQAVLLDAMTEEEQWNARVTAALDVVLPDVWCATKYVAWKQCERLLPHVLLCLQRAKETSESLPLASLVDKTASYLLSRGRYAEAKSLFYQALSIRERALGPEHPEVASSLNHLAILLLDQGKHAEAVSLFQQALQIRERVLDPEHPEVALSLDNLAEVYCVRGKYVEAELLVRRALQIREQTLAEDDPLQEFLKACCELHPLAWCRISELWHAYEQWTASVQKRIPLSRRTFAAQVQARGCQVDRVSAARIWRGITLRDKAS
ncbi:MAG TPA: tetratricopeptide repeat protein [Ktedonobacteraceae bacterium]